MTKVRMDVIRFEEYTDKETGEKKHFPRRVAEVVEKDNGDGYFLNIPVGVALSGDWQILPRQEKQTEAA